MMMRRARAAEAMRKSRSERYAKSAAGEAAKQSVKVSIAEPAGAKGPRHSGDELTFKLRASTAKTAVEAIRSHPLARGWESGTKPLDQLTGSVRLS